MKISWKWIQEFFEPGSLKMQPHEVGEVLTRGGLELEGVEDNRQFLKQVVIGLILEKDQHPSADRLSVCQVTTGGGVVHKIVCGARNHQVGDRVIVALPGARLPGDLEIKASSLRGVESAGMLCSLREIGQGAEGEGIAILAGDAPLGETYAQYAGLDDVIFDLKVTPNRGDALSHLGIARELAALLNLTFKLPFEAFDWPKKLAVSEGVPTAGSFVHVAEVIACPRYSGVRLEGVRVGPSPAWLRQRLTSCGLNSINNIVDITNLVMLELGQPMHAFDLDQLHGNEVVVRKASPQERFVSLTGQEMNLAGDEVVIADRDHVLALAGVIGGKDSGVSEQTCRVFLEAAHFNACLIRKAATRWSINTDSSYRFVRGVDPAGTVLALSRAVQLIVQVCPEVRIVGDLIDGKSLPDRKSISVNTKNISDRLGYAASPEIFRDYLIRLGGEIESQESEQFIVTPPTYRFDLDSEIDFVEEYARIKGYSEIPETLPTLDFAPTRHNDVFLKVEALRNRAVAAGYLEAVHSVFTDEKNEIWSRGHQTESFGLKLGRGPVILKNPLSRDQSILRPSLWQSLWNTVIRNYRQGNEVGRMFEIGRVFFEADQGGQIEAPRLAFAAWGLPHQYWTRSANHHPLFDIKGAIEEMFHRNDIQILKVTDRSRCPIGLHQGQLAEITVGDVKVGWLAGVSPLWLEEGKVRTQVALAELDLEGIFGAGLAPIDYQAVPDQPGVIRDLSIVIPKTQSTGPLLSQVKKTFLGVPVSEIYVFDVFEGGNLPLGQKSVTLRVKFQNPGRTLTDGEISQALEKLKLSLETA